MYNPSETYNNEKSIYGVRKIYIYYLYCASEESKKLFSIHSASNDKCESKAKGVPKSHVYVYVIALQSVRMEIFAHLCDIKTWR